MKRKRIRRALLAVLCVALFTVAASATDGGSTSATIQAAFQTGFQSMVSDALSMIAAIVPIALGLAGVVFVVRKALGWFKAVAK